MLSKAARRTPPIASCFCTTLSASILPRYSGTANSGSSSLPSPPPPPPPPGGDGGRGKGWLGRRRRRRRRAADISSSRSSFAGCGTGDAKAYWQTKGCIGLVHVIGHTGKSTSSTRSVGVLPETLASSPQWDQVCHSSSHQPRWIGDGFCLPSVSPRPSVRIHRVYESHARPCRADSIAGDGNRVV